MLIIIAAMASPQARVILIANSSLCIGGKTLCIVIHNKKSCRMFRHHKCITSCSNSKNNSLLCHISSNPTSLTVHGNHNRMQFIPQSMLLWGLTAKEIPIHRRNKRDICHNNLLRVPFNNSNNNPSKKVSKKNQPKEIIT